MNRMMKWAAAALLLIGVGVGGTVLLGPQLGLSGPTPVQAQAATNETAASTLQTVKIQPAANVIGQVSASGKLALAQTHYVVLDVEGEVQSVNVQVGEQVQAGVAQGQQQAALAAQSSRRWWRWLQQRLSWRATAAARCRPTSPTTSAWR